MKNYEPKANVEQLGFLTVREERKKESECLLNEWTLCR